MNSLKKLSMTAAGVTCLSLSCLLPTKVAAATFDAIYTFGDSFVDNGNFYRTALNFPGLLPLTAFPGYPDYYYEGRFSDGPVWVEYLAPLLGLPVTAGQNYAFGGATSGTNHVAPLPLPYFPGLLTQVETFTTQFPTADPNALYIISAGSNDYGGLSLYGAAPAVVTAAVAETVGNLENAITMLNEVGVYNILVVTVPDFGQIPSSQKLEPELRSFLSSLADEHNSTLAASLTELSSSLDIDITLLDIDSILEQVIINPEQFGFTNVTESCFNPITKEVCSNPDEYLFWDESHSTAAAHQHVANFALAELNKVETIPEPSSILGILVFGAAGTSYLVTQKLKRQHKKPDSLDAVRQQAFSKKY